MTFDLLRGECLAVVGESGSGKTTLARCLLRLVEPTSGKVRYRGEEVLAFDRRALLAFRKSVQIVFQDPFGSLNPRMRAGEVLQEVLEVHGGPRSSGELEARVVDLLHLVGMHQEHRWRYPHELSGGQRQRLGIARALAVEPELLVLDEPVSALDVSVRAQILNLLADLRERLSLTLLLVAHDLSVVRQVADRAAVLYLGEIVEMGPVEDLLGDPRHPYTRGLLAAAEPGPLDGEAGEGRELLPGEPPSPSRPPLGCSLYPRCPHLRKDDECRRQRPDLVQLSGARQLACWKENRPGGRPLTHS